MIRPSNASKRFFAWWLMIVLCAMPVTTWGESIIVMATDGPLPAVVSADTPHDRDAAIDLCNYLSRIVGRHIEPTDHVGDARVVIHVGRDDFVREHAPDLDELFADGFVIRGVEVDGRFHLILAGRMARASQWAIERFLSDHCGVRWLFPDPMYGEVVPARPTITIERNIARTIEPDYLGRGTVSYNHHYNPTTTFVRGGSGVERQFGQHAIQFIFNNGAHSGEIFEQHPEWFAFFNGKRQWWEYGNGWQICSTNPETVAHAVKYVLDYFEKNPDSLVVSVGSNDGWGECECPECTAFLASADPAYTVSERWFTWVNKVAREVAKVHPDKWVETLAYSQTSVPTRFALEPNVAITKTFVFDSEFQNARDWGAVCKSVNLYSYMYGNSFMGFRHYPHAARDFLKWGHDELGSRAHVTESGGDWTFDGPKVYYLHALMWDVNADVDAIMDDFCRQSYGAAAKPMRAFWDRFEEIYERRRPVPYGMINRRWLFYQWTSWKLAFYVQPNDEFQEYTKDDIAYLDARMAEAMALAADDGEAVGFRVERMREAWGYYRTMLVSFTQYYGETASDVTTPAALDRALTLATEVADLRVERDRMVGAMRMYPHINSRTSANSYWGYFHALTIFNHELTLMDELCTSITRYLLQTADDAQAAAFWQRIDPNHNLFAMARMQLDGLADAAGKNLLINGDFETGDLTGWETRGPMTVVPGDGRAGRFIARTEGTAAEASQQVAVAPNGHYRLSAWARYPSAPPAIAAPLESIVEFYAGERRIWDSEPARAVLRTTNPQAGWVALRSTIVAPPTTTHVIIRLKRDYSGSAEWADVRFEQVGAGVGAQAGRLTDTFDAYLDGALWHRSTYSPGTRPPEVRAGALVYDSPDMHGLTSYASVNQLLDYDGDERYRLQLRVARAAPRGQPASLTFAIQGGTGVTRIGVSGMYWLHVFGNADAPVKLQCFASQGTQGTYNSTYPVRQVPTDAGEVWYSLEFDRQFVSVYAGANGYDVSEAALVARYPHGISDLSDGGGVYLKLFGQASRLDEISLSTSAILPSPSAPPLEPTNAVDPRELTMPDPE